MEYPNTFQLEVTFDPANATNKSVSYESDNVAVATVDSNGLITAAGVGTCNVVVKSLENETLTATCRITVELMNIPLKGVTLSITEKTIYVAPTEAK